MQKHRGFSITEAFVAMVIIGIIVTLSLAGVKSFSPKDDDYKTASIKMAENIEQASLQILINNAPLDDFKVLRDEKGQFSIEDANVTDRMAKLFVKYLSNIDYKIDLNKEYFSQTLKDYDKSSTGVVLKNKFSNFVFVADGVLIGFAFYKGCNKNENLATLPRKKGKYKETNICGAIFYDINSYDKPNKLGSDQYILPVYERGIKYGDV